jgi:hypothetical protein
MAQPKSEIKTEIEALEVVLSALASLDEATRRRVLAYVHERFGIAGPAERAPLSPPGIPSEDEQPRPRAGGEPVADIRTLKERKAPKSAVEMAVLVAFYLSEVAPDAERKNSITTADVTKYFKQAGYRLPPRPRITLHQAKNAGYLDSGARGEYSLNPVGYNLVTHGLPRSSSSSGSSSAATKRTKPKKKTAPGKRSSGSKPRKR